MIHEIEISRFTQHTELRLRDCIDPDHVTKYTHTWTGHQYDDARNHCDDLFPPITMADVDGDLLVTNEWYSIESQRRMGIATVLCKRPLRSCAKSGDKEMTLALADNGLKLDSSLWNPNAKD
jgi:hypothetical protein